MPGIKDSLMSFPELSKSISDLIKSIGPANIFMFSLFQTKSCQQQMCWLNINVETYQIKFLKCLFHQKIRKLINEMEKHIDL